MISQKAALRIDDESLASEILQELHARAETTSGAMMVLRQLSLMDLPAAKELAVEYLQDHNPTQRSDYDASAISLAAKIVIRSLEGDFDSEEAHQILSYAADILEKTTDSMLVKGTMYALSEFESDEVIPLIVDKLDLEEYSSTAYLLSIQEDLTREYLLTAPVEDVTECVQAAPLKEFIPALESRLNARSAQSEEERMAIEGLISYIENPQERASRSVNTNYGRAAYRDGVGIEGTTIDFWHAGIVSDVVNSPVIHIGGEGQQVEYATLTKFIHNDPKPITRNKFLGVYKHKDEEDNRDRILSMAENLRMEYIDYVVITMVELTSDVLVRPQDYCYSPDEIQRIRCDGVVEYCYEFWGLRLQGSNSNWDISQVRGAFAHNVFQTSPRDQSKYFTRYSSII